MISECSISVVLVGFLPFGSSLPAKFFSISLQKSSTKQNSLLYLPWLTSSINPEFAFVEHHRLHP